MEEVEIEICARDDTYKLLIWQELENIIRCGGITEESFKDLCENHDLNDSERECLQNNLTLLGLYGSN